MGGIAQKKVKSNEPGKTFIVVCADSKESHVWAEVSVGCDDKEVYLLHLCLRSLLKKPIIYHMCVRVEEEEVKDSESLIKGEHGHHLLLNRIPESRALRGTRCLLS